jgi:uncharacterized membrane protein
MNILLLIIAGLVGLIALVFLIALFTRRAYAVEREITINKPKQEVFDFIRYLRNQDNFSKWATMDPNMRKAYRGTDGTVGFVSAWDSEVRNVGKGEQTIKSITEGESIDFDLHFIRPFDSKANAHMYTEFIAADQTRVKWSFDSRMKYPMNIMLFMMNMEKMIGNDLDTGLRNLKNALENQSGAGGFIQAEGSSAG